MADVLGTFEQAVLVSILRLADEAYGRAIMSAVKGLQGREIAAGAVHATLERLERKQLISSSLASGTPIRAGRPRRYYTVLPKGIRALNEARSMIDTLWSGLQYPLGSRT
jgi:DNA-binding PadR family transcriptional regulator